MQAAGVGIEPTASWFRARRHYQQRLSRIVRVQRHTFLLMVRRKLRGQESNLRTPGSKPGITTNSDDPAMLPTEGRAGLEPARWYLTGTCSAAELPTQSICKSALRESNPPTRFGRPTSNRSIKDTRYVFRHSREYLTPPCALLSNDVDI